MASGVTAVGRILCCLHIIILLLLWRCQRTEARRGVGDRPQYRTAYACEGNQLTISCDGGHLIHLIRANYGRFSISICNDHGNLDWSVDCMSRLSFRVMQESCGLKRGCSLPASSGVFGDPCPGTLKYLEAHYQCVPAEATTTTRRPMGPPGVVFGGPSLPPVGPSFSPGLGGSNLPGPPPPAPINVSFSPPGIATTTTSTTTTTNRPNVINVAVVATGSGKNGSHTPGVVVISNEIHVAEEETTPSPMSRPVHSTTDLTTDFCAPVHSRYLFWNWTRAGDTAIQKCPGGTRGEARWHCSMQSMRWYPDRPDLGGCTSPWVDNLNDRLQEGASVVNIAADFALITRKKPFYGGDVVQAMVIIQQLISKMQDRVIEFPDEKQRFQVVKELVQSVVDISSNLLDESQSEAWQDLSDVEQRVAAGTMLHSVERNIRLLADTQNRETQFSHAQTNILATMQIVRAQTVSDLSLPNPESISGTSWTHMEDAIHLPSAALLEASRNGLTRVVYVSYNMLDTILMPTQQQQMFYQHSQSKEPVIQIINSRIVTLSLGREREMRLSEPVIMTLKHLQDLKIYNFAIGTFVIQWLFSLMTTFMEENVTNPRCVFWDFEEKSWSQKGCHMEATNRSHTVCICYHLTNFAILMDVKATVLTFEHEIALRIITYVGCVISIVCLVLTVLTFQFFRGLKGDRTTIHKNLCLCLLIAELVFVCGIGQTHLKIVCGVIAGALHYFFLAAFFWMFLEGFQLYVMLVEVFETEKSRVKWYYLAAYGIPALIVGISAGIDPYSYGSDRYCWLRADNYFIFSFIGPVIAILLANIIFLTIAVYMMCRHANMSVVTKVKEQAKLTKFSDEESYNHRRLLVVVWLRGAMILVFLLGITWAFGLLYLSAETLFMAYVFTIFNSLQGLFIFVFHCIRNEKVQKEYQKFIHRSSWLPECMKSARGQERSSSFYVHSHSNGTVSGQPSSGQISSSQQQSWLSKERSSGNSSVPKSATHDHSISTSTTTTTTTTSPPESCGTLTNQKSGGTLKQGRVVQPTERTVQPSEDKVQNEGGEEEEAVPDYTLRESRDCFRPHHYHHAKHHSPPPPYGQMSGVHFLDHIYECIDTDCETPTIYKRRCLKNLTTPDGHIRSHSDSSRQSSSSCGCDQRPLIPPNLPQRNAAIAHLAQVLNTAPRHSSLPTAKDMFLRHHADVAEGDHAVGSLPDIQGYHLVDPRLVSAAQQGNGQPAVVQDSLRCGLVPDNAVVMAVLDGERVVCRLSPETVSPNTRTHYCHKFSHLSTDC